jgi:hypothetical protein
MNAPGGQRDMMYLMSVKIQEINSISGFYILIAPVRSAGGQKRYSVYIYSFKFKKMSS